MIFIRQINRHTWSGPKETGHFAATDFPGLDRIGGWKLEKETLTYQQEASWTTTMYSH